MRSAGYYILKALHDAISALACFFFRLLYGESKKLPPIKDTLLLEPAWHLAEKIRKGQLKSEDLVKAYITRIKEVNPCINAVVDERYDDALEEARQCDRLVASGEKSEHDIKEQTPLLGIPFSCKDIIAVKGLSFTNGLVSNKGMKAEEDADAVKMIRDAGAIPLVSTNVPELSTWHETNNRLYGTTNNPYDTRRGCGGSTGGEGALVGAAGSVIGLGNDLAGSIRMPAFMNGVFGHKATRGMVPNTDYIEPEDDYINYLSTGPLCRYATDLLPVMKVLTNKELRHHLDRTVDFKKLKIYYAVDDGGGNPLVTPVHPQIKNILKRVVRHFEDDYGIESEHVRIEDLDAGFEIWFHALMELGLSPVIDHWGEGKDLKMVLWELGKWCVRASNHTLATIVLGLYESIMRNNIKARKKAQEKCKKLNEVFQKMLDENTVFLYPTHPEPAPYHHDTVPKMWNIGYTSIFSILGLPVTQVPLSQCNGLPIGIQIVGANNNDALTLAIAVELEEVFGGWKCP